MNQKERERNRGKDEARHKITGEMNHIVEQLVTLRNRTPFFLI